ncbi:hypothetical protein [Streptomyces sp. CA2R106]|uniref:hypothetical protein n=1 Tax=Streptomyces sp. CA2R106 TaxID=3120153 RepID=UPI00300BDC80
MTQHDRPAPSDPPQRGAAATVSAVLRRQRGALVRATAQVVGLAGLAWLLLTAAVFACSWPLFTHMRNQRNRYHYVEDPYVHDHTGLAKVALGTLPLFLLLLGIASAALQSACSRAVTAASTVRPTGVAAEPGAASGRTRIPALLTVYTLRGLITWPLVPLAVVAAHGLFGYHPNGRDAHSWSNTLLTCLLVLAVLAAVLLRVGLALAPAAAAAGLNARTALRRSWSQVWTRAGAGRVLALTLPAAALCALLARLATQVALPARPAVRHLLADTTGNFFAGYYAGILAPVILGLLTAAALTYPFTCTAFATLHDRLSRPPRARVRRAAGAAAGPRRPRPRRRP